MRRIREDLWQTSLDVTEGVNSAGFLLLRPEGNVLFYKAPSERFFEQITALGGIQHHVLSHRHEAAPSPAAVKKAFGSRLCCDALEAPSIRASSEADVLFEKPGDSLGSVEVLRTPGHTQGGLSCVYRSPLGEVYLFSGDTMIPVKGRWIAQTVAADGGDAATLTQSLLRLRELEPDLILSSASVGEESVVAVGREQWTRAVDEVAGRAPIAA